MTRKTHRLLPGEVPEGRGFGIKLEASAHKRTPRPPRELGVTQRTNLRRNQTVLRNRNP